MYEMIRFKNHCYIWTIRLLDSWCTFFYRFPWSLWYQGKILQSARLCLTMRLFWEKNFGGDWEDVGQRSAWMFGCVGKETCKKKFFEKFFKFKKFFFDDLPTTIDAVCYGHLAVLINILLSFNDIKVGSICIYFIYFYCY